MMAVLAHPDDESLGMGGTLVKYAKEGVETFLVTATRGERGRYGDLEHEPSIEEVGKIREKELLEASKILGIREVNFLDYIDKDLDQANPGEAIARIVYYIRKYRPHVVITFGPEGGYGHPDHIAISQFTGAAIVCAADREYSAHDNIKIPDRPHRVSKLYYMAWAAPKWKAYQAAFKDLKSLVDGVERRVEPFPEWLITTRIDTTKYWKTVWEAVQCHKTQMAIYKKIRELPEDQHLAIWGTQEFYRVFSTVNGGRDKESDIFEGLR